MQDGLRESWTEEEAADRSPRHPFAWRGLLLLGCRGEGVEFDEEVAGTAQCRVRPVRGRVGDQPGVHEPVGQRQQRHLCLDPGQGAPKQ
jgi:hypothetical protein